MSYSLIQTWFLLSFLWPIIATALYIVYVKKFWKWITARKSLNSMFIKMIPVLILFLLSVLPLFYFQGLMKNFDHCRQIIDFNKKYITRENLFTKEPKCSKYNVDELFTDIK